MNAKGKVLVAWVFIVIAAAFFVSHFSHHLLFVIENCLALVLPGGIR